ncbi:MAG: arginine repressor [Planctomycetes bacterium]|nr:arginine repressor [Planctomycetota bacterium]
MKTQTGKAGRHEAILKIVGEKVVRTQGELRKLLSAKGFPVDQATLSRDLRELGLVKVPGQDGEGTHYVLVSGSIAPHTEDALAVLARFVHAADWSANLVVLKTGPGNAQALGLALDRLHWEDVLGTIAGDDTVLVVVREGARARRVAERIKALARL